MPSLQCVMTTFLWDEEPTGPDSVGLYGYNLYGAHIRLQASDIPVTVAHYTRNRRFQQGVLARIIGMGHTVGNSFLIVAVSVTLVSFLPIPGPLPSDYDLLARITFSGVVSSEYAPLERSAQGFMVEITIDRPDVYPPEPMVLLAVFDRDATRVELNARLAIGTNVYGRGVVCGWSTRKMLMVDVHHIEYNSAGDAPKHVLTDPLNPYRGVVLASDGWPSREKPEPTSSAPGPTWEIVSFSSIPSRILPANGAGDPRLAGRAGAVPAAAAAVVNGGQNRHASSPTITSPSSVSTGGDDGGPAATANVGLAPSPTSARDEHIARCRCGATNANDCSARLVSGWKPTAALQAAGIVVDDPMDSQAAAALLALGRSASSKVDNARAAEHGGQKSPPSGRPDVPPVSITLVQRDRDDPAGRPLSMRAFRDALKRKATTPSTSAVASGSTKRPRDALYASPSTSAVASGSSKRPRVMLHVTQK